MTEFADFAEEEIDRRAVEVIAIYNAGASEQIVPPWSVDGPERFMIVSATNDGDRLWVAFASSIDEIEAHLGEWIYDEWGLVAIHDLESDNYTRQLTFDCWVETKGLPED